MKIALAQMEVVPGRPEINLESMLSMIEESKRKGVDLVVFPEMAVGGYLLGDKWLSDDFCLDLIEYNEELLKASDGIAIAYGNIFVDNEINARVGDNKIHPNKDGRSRKYNAIYVVQDGKPVKRVSETKILPSGVQPKTLLPNYRFFDDERYFFSLEDVAKDFSVGLEDLVSPFLIKIDGKEMPVGFELCEDLWCEDYRRDGNAFNITKILISNGAKKIVNLSASPWTYGKNSARDRRIQFLKKDSGKDFVPFFYVNCTGVQNNGKNIVTFDGGSTVYNTEGMPVVLSSRAYDPELIVVEDKDLEGRVLEREEKSKIAQKYDSIIRGIRHAKDISGGKDQPRYVIGLSGGIDSSVVAALLAKAVGPGKVLGINMPSKYNSKKTKDAAMKVAEKLGIGYEIIPIDEIYRVNSRLIDSIDPDGSSRKLSPENLENVQAKLRGTSVLSNIAAKYGALFTNNGNKLEVALGYATLYGDWGGAISPIADLTKTEVVELAKYLNKEVYRREVIPESLLPDELWRFREDQIKPSAELKKDQIDPMKFGYHCALLEAMTDYIKKTPEEIMKWYLEGTLEKNLGISTALIKRWGMHKPRDFIMDLEWFDSLLNKNVFKRIQAPPIVMTSKSSFGYDIRESMLPYHTSRQYARLKEQVLKMEEYVPGGKK